MPVPDPRTRNKASLVPTKVFATSIPSAHLPQILLANVLFATALHAGKEWLLDFDVGIFWVIMRVLACGGLGVLVWEGVMGQLARRKDIEWSVLGMAALLLFVQQACLFTALFRLSSIRVALFTHFSTLWLESLLTRTSARKTLIVVAALVGSVLSDTQMSSENFWRLAPAYCALALHSLASGALEHTYGVLAPSLGNRFTVAASTLGASLIALPLYCFRTVLMNFPSTPVLPITSFAAIPLLAYALLFLAPNTARSVRRQSSAPQYFAFSYPSTSVLAAVIGALAFSQFPTWTDLLVGVLLYYGMFPDALDSIGGTPRADTSRLIRSYLKTILSNPESRKIFYFLMLNMCYMLVQMLYGVWTNSLGLISDAIHMAFDCMAIAMGLFASVMATWEPNERFTYGYGRIETLSGFANGIFLILISIFIVFEAIQRLLDPPEMNTSQLLLVSSLGLAVNLFGMFAMGGHHHGGHSHSHGHSHGADSHASHATHEGEVHAHSPTENHSHSHAPGENHSHSHSPTESHGHSPVEDQYSPVSPTEHHSHSHSPPSAFPYGHTPGDAPLPSARVNTPASAHSHSHSHSPPTPHSASHSHSHEGEHHGHSHSHDHQAPAGLKELKRPFRGPAIQTRGSHLYGSESELSPLSPLSAVSGVHSQAAFSPITPNYRFGHDEHYDTHHAEEHAPNLHNHAHAHERSQEGHSHNMRGVFLHVMADTLGSVGVIISTLLIQLYGWTGFDPIASLFIAILIAASVVPLVVDTGKVLSLDVGDRDEVIEKALAELSSVEGLASYTNPRFWPKDATSLIGSIHVQLAPSPSSYDPSGPHSSRRTTYASLDAVVGRVDTLLRSRIAGLEELTIQAEGSEYPGHRP